MRTRKSRTVVLGDLRFPVTSEAPHAAREMVGIIFDLWSIADPHSAQLCVSELTTNVCAPRGALSYPRFSREELEGGFWV
jgi:hypothetical protein